MSKVSVIIPSYNCAEYIKETLESVLNQSYKDLEAIVVDDSSSDDTESIVKPFLSYENVKYIKRSERGGPSAARNTGIEKAEGELITFLDGDDIYLEDKVLEQVRFFENNRSCDICYTNELYFDTDTGRELPSPWYHFSGDIFYYLKRSNFIPVCSVMIKAEILKKNRYDERKEVIGHEDWEIFLRLAFEGYNFYFIDKPLSKIRVRKRSVTVSDGMSNSRKEVGLLARKYWKDFKKLRNVNSSEGIKAMLRYSKLKTKAFLIGFPNRKCFNRPLAWELFAEKGK